MKSHPDILKREKIIFMISFILINFFLCSYFIDIWLTPNSTSRALPVLTLYENKSIMIDQYNNFTGDKSKINNHYYSDKAPLSTFIVYPFYSVFRQIGLPEIKKFTLEKFPIYIWEDAGMVDGRSFLLPQLSSIFILGGLLTGTIPFLLILLISFLCIRKTSGFSPVLLVMLTFFSSFMFIYSGVYTGHILAGLLLFITYLLLKSKTKFFISGISLGLALTTEYTVAIVIPFWLIQILLNEKKFIPLLKFISGLIPGIIIILFYNYSITGSLITTQYSYVANQEYQHVSHLGFGYPSIEALWGLLFTQFRGLIFYIPVLIFMIFYFIKANNKHITTFFKYKKTPYLQQWSKNYLLSSFIFYVLLISSHKIWTGGWSFGPRHLIPITFPLIYEGILLLSKNTFSKYIFVFMGSIGVIITWMAKSTKLYMLPDYPIYPKPFFNIILRDFNLDKFNSNNILTLFADAPPQLANWLWLIIFSLSIIILHFWFRSLYPEKIISSQKLKTQPKKSNNRK